MIQMSPSSDELGVSLFLPVEQVAKRYDVSTDSIWRWVRNNKFPAPVRVGAGTTRWRLADLNEHDGALQCCFMTCMPFLLAA